MSIKDLITEKIRNNYSPVHFELINESHLHKGSSHSESHFKLTVISDLFSGMALVKRHQMIYKSLELEIKSIHALSLKLYTPAEWEENNQQTPKSPDCSNS